MRTSIFPLLFLAAAPVGALADTPAGPGRTPDNLEVTSSAFGENQAIPIEFTCEQANVSPPLAWSQVPAGTRSIAILVDDVDAPRGRFTHWLVTGLPPEMSSLDQAMILPKNTFEAKNDMGTTGYTGPCPTAGRHRYHFRVYALDFNPGASMTREEFIAAVPGRILATGDLVGTYAKQKGRQP